MSDVEVEPYVEDVEFRTTQDGEADNDWMILHCVAGDVYEAFFEGGAWWLVFLPGDPSEGPFDTSDDVIDWLNDEDH